MFIVSCIFYFICILGVTVTDSVKNAVKVKYGRCIKNEELLRIYGISLVECRRECRRRESCASFNYKRHFMVCEINDINKELEDEKYPGHVYHRRTGSSEVCTPACGDGKWCNTKTNMCETKECGPPPRVRNATIDGNRRDVGSKLRYTCDNQKMASVVCEVNGSWGEPPACFVKTIGTECKYNSDCLEPNSICVDEKCFCTYLTRYNPQTGFCDIECQQYKDSFVMYENRAISYYNHEIQMLSIPECMEYCINYGVTCGSIDINKNNGACSIGKITYQQLQDADPSAFKESTQFEFYTRQC